MSEMEENWKKGFHLGGFDLAEVRSKSGRDLSYVRKQGGRGVCIAILEIVRVKISCFRLNIDATLNKT